MMNQPETRRTKLSGSTEKEAVTDRTRILHEYPRPNLANVGLGKALNQFLIKRHAKGGT